MFRFLSSWVVAPVVICLNALSKPLWLVWNCRIFIESKTVIAFQCLPLTPLPPLSGSALNLGTDMVYVTFGMWGSWGSQSFTWKPSFKSVLKNVSSLHERVSFNSFFDLWLFGKCMRNCYCLHFLSLKCLSLNHKTMQFSPPNRFFLTSLTNKTIRPLFFFSSSLFFCYSLLQEIIFFKQESLQPL